MGSMIILMHLKRALCFTCLKGFVVIYFFLEKFEDGFPLIWWISSLARDSQKIICQHFRIMDPVLQKLNSFQVSD